MPRAAEASMNKRRLLPALGITGALLATVVLITPLRLLVLGFFNREHFYRGMPSSYWSFTIQNWSHNIDEGRDRPAPGFGTAIGYLGMGGDVPPILRGGEPAVPVLCDLLKDENEFVRFKAAQSLASMGTAAKDAIPVLSDALGGRDTCVRYWASIALGRMGTEAQPVIGAMLKLTKHPDVGVRIDTARALWNLTQQPDPAVPVLMELLTPNEAPMRLQALHVLAEIGPPAEPAIRVITRATRDEITDVRIAAADALWKVSKR